MPTKTSLSEELTDSIRRIAMERLSVNENAKLVQQIEELKEKDREKQELRDKKNGIVRLTAQEMREHLYSEANISIGEKEEMTDEIKKRKARIDFVQNAIDAEVKANDDVIEHYSSTVFMFITRDNFGTPTYLYFIPQKVAGEMHNGRVILSGVVIFQDKMMIRELVINLDKNLTYYTAPGMRRKSLVLPAPQTADEWNTLCQGLLSAALDNRVKLEDMPQ